MKKLFLSLTLAILTACQAPIHLTEYTPTPVECKPQGKINHSWMNEPAREVRFNFDGDKFYDIEVRHLDIKKKPYNTWHDLRVGPGFNSNRVMQDLDNYAACKQRYTSATDYHQRRKPLYNYEAD